MKKSYSLLLIILVLIGTYSSMVHAVGAVKEDKKAINGNASNDTYEFRQVFDLGGEGNSDVIQDKDGFLWFSSFGGLIRYDGYDVKRYNAGKNSLSSNSVTAIFEDSDGIIWIGTKEAGINSYDKETNKFKIYKNNVGDETSISSDLIKQQSTSKIVEDKNGFLWFATSLGLNKLDKKTGKFKRYLNDASNSNSLINNNVYTLAFDFNNSDWLWIGTENGLDRLNIKTGKFKHYQEIPGEKDSLSGKGNKITALVPAPSGDIWIGTSDGVDKFDPKTGKFTFINELPGIEPWSMSLDGDELLITYAFKNKAAIIYNIKTGKVSEITSGEKNKLSSDTIKAFFKDNNDAYWVVHTAGAVDKYDKKEKKIILYKDGKDSLSEKIAFPRLEDSRGDIWIGTTANGPTKYDRKKRTFTHYPGRPKENPKSIPNNYPSAIFEATNGDFWLGTWGGLVKYNRDTAESEKVIKEINQAYIIREDPDNPDILWIGTYQLGFFKYNTKSGEIKNFKHDKKNSNSIGNDVTISFVIDSENPNIMWLATHGGGLNKFDKTTEKFTSFIHNKSNPESIVSNIVWNVYQDSNGNIWVCTDNGLDKFDKKTGSFKHYQEGFPGKIVYLAIEDDFGDLWFATDGGLVKFDLNKEKVVKVYTVEDGLQSHAFFGTGIMKAKDGEIFIGGFTGMNRFYPSNLKDNDFNPPVYITDLEQGGKKVKVDSALERVDEVVLDAKNNFFEFKYAALNYTNPSKNRYKYKLEGWDKDFYDAGTSREARYTGLNPGMYILKIIAANNDGIWSDKAAEIDILVKPDLEETDLLFSLDNLKEDKSISLNYLNDKFTIEVVPVDYSIVKDNRYSYKLEGYDKEWVNLKNRRYVTYSQVPPGNYNFKIKEGDKVVMDIPVYITPPFYKALWFRISVGIFLLVLFIFIYLLRTRALRRKHAYLEQVVAERTRELKKTNSELFEAREKAEAATKAKSEFLANMSHEIRTPMNAILGFSEILLHKVEDPKIKKYLNTIASSGNSLLRLINDILDLSKIEAGKFDIQYSPVNVQTVFKEIAIIFQHKLGEKELDFILDVPKDIPTGILLDETRLRQILTNLVGNSIKFTEKGFIKLALCYKYQGADKTHMNLDIFVEDSGIGIPEESQNTIFEAFTQVSGQQVSKYGGTGLGLTITKRLVEAMNGTISLESEVGKGTVFKIVLRNIETASLDIKDGQEEVDDFNLASIKFKSAKILIADDIDYNRELLRGFFDDGYEFEIIEAEDGAEAIKLTQEHNPDLLLLDLKMPAMSGYDVIRLMKADEKLKNIKVIILTASAMKSEEISVKELCDGYLRKPVKRNALIKEIMKFLPYEKVEQKKVIKEEIQEIKILDEELIGEIKLKILPIINDLEKRLSIKKLESLSGKCSELGSLFQNDILLDFSEQMSVALKEYNLDELEKLVFIFRSFL